jgi:hypothetical protein
VQYIFHIRSEPNRKDGSTFRYTLMGTKKFNSPPSDLCVPVINMGAYISWYFSAKENVARFRGFKKKHCILRVSLLQVRTMTGICPSHSISLMAIISTCYNSFRKADQNGLVTKCFPVCVIHDDFCVLAMRT